MDSPIRSSEQRSSGWITGLASQIRQNWVGSPELGGGDQVGPVTADDDVLGQQRQAVRLRREPAEQVPDVAAAADAVRHGDGADPYARVPARRLQHLTPLGTAVR